MVQLHVSALRFRKRGNFLVIDFWQAFRALLGELHGYITAHPDRAETVASELYRTVVWSEPDEVPEDLNFIYHFDDAFSLAREGFGETRAVLAEFLSELEKFRGQVHR